MREAEFLVSRKEQGRHVSRDTFEGGVGREQPSEALR